MRSNLRSRKHLRAKQARERISHIESSRAAPLHTPGASLTALFASRQVGVSIAAGMNTWLQILHWLSPVAEERCERRAYAR